MLAEPVLPIQMLEINVFILLLKGWKWLIFNLKYLLISLNENSKFWSINNWYFAYKTPKPQMELDASNKIIKKALCKQPCLLETLM